METEIDDSTVAEAADVEVAEEFSISAEQIARYQAVCKMMVAGDSFNEAKKVRYEGLWLFRFAKHTFETQPNFPIVLGCDEESDMAAFYTAQAWEIGGDMNSDDREATYEMDIRAVLMFFPPEIVYEYASKAYRTSRKSKGPEAFGAALMTLLMRWRHEQLYNFNHQIRLKSIADY